MNAIANQIGAAFAQLETGPWREAETLWLTFYLSGAPDDLERLGHVLGSRGWLNLSGGEGAFIYPKLQVERGRDAVLNATRAAEALCAKHGVEIVLIDADTSADVKATCFVTLYKPES